MTKRYFNESHSGNNDGFFSNELKSLLKGLKKDDLILLGIILILIGDGCEDKELLLMLGFLFVSDKINITENLLKEN